MQEVTGDIWDFHEQGHLVCITTNGFVKKNGECVMGAGVAKQAKVKFPDLPARVGEDLRLMGNGLNFYGDIKLIMFPVKHNWYEQADIELIKQSCEQLIQLMDFKNIKKVYLPKPGCGNGKLRWPEVKKVIEPLLDDRVIIIDKK